MRAVFLDRDGVINEAIVQDGRPYAPRGLHQVIIAADAAVSLKRLKERGFLLLVVTNQPDVRRGTITRESVDEIHRFLARRLPLDDFFACYHDDLDACSCRKPLPGLLLSAAAKYDVDIAKSYLIGDRWRDIDAGNSAGCPTVLIDRCYEEPHLKSSPTAIASSLGEAVDWILNREAEAH